MFHCSSEKFIDALLEFWHPQKNEFNTWRERIHEIKNQFNMNHTKALEVTTKKKFIHSVDAIKSISNFASNNAIIVTDVGAALLSGHYAFEIKNGQRFFTSQGLGEMGFGLPAAVGAFIGSPERPIICLNTDGAIMFNLQDLQLVHEYKIPLKLFIFSNDGYAMIKISQNNLFGGNLIGSTTETGISFPDFGLLANTFNMKYKIFSDIDLLNSELAYIFDSPESFLIEIKMDPDQKYFPRLATTKTSTGDFISPPLEDLDPKISLSELEFGLGYSPTEDSILARK